MFFLFENSPALRPCFPKVACWMLEKPWETELPAARVETSYYEDLEGVSRSCWHGKTQRKEEISLLTSQDLLLPLPVHPFPPAFFLSYCVSHTSAFFFQPQHHCFSPVIAKMKVQGGKKTCFFHSAPQRAEGNCVSGSGRTCFVLWIWTYQHRPGETRAHLEGSRTQTFGSFTRADIQIRRPAPGAASRRMRSLLRSVGNWQCSLIGVRVWREWDSDVNSSKGSNP